MKALGQRLQRAAPSRRPVRRTPRAARQARNRWSERARIADPFLARSAAEPEIEFVQGEEVEIDYERLRKFSLVQPYPGVLQQTLWRSFAIGGIGLHSGEMSYVRVRPAFAGEGRYFVRVPLGTNRDLTSPYEGQDVQIYPEGENVLDEDAEVLRSELFLKYLDFKDREGYVGDFRQFIEHYAEKKGLKLTDEERILEREDPVPKSPSDVIIPATLASLANEEPLYETTLENEQGDRVESVEHLLAALEACGIDNARIEIEGGPEVPIVDGSSLGWTVDIERVGVTIAECEGEEREFFIRAALKPDEVVRVQEGDAFVALIPGDKMQLTYGIDHTEECPIIGSQWFSWCLQDDRHFKLHLAPAKTYVTYAEKLYTMREQGYVKGGSEHVVIIGNGMEWYDEQILSFGLDEPVRHKILDLIGDLSLMGEGGMSGLPFGHIIAHKATHAMHHAFAKKLLEKYSESYEQYAYPDEPQDEIAPEDSPDLDLEELKAQVKEMESGEGPELDTGFL